MKQFNTYIIEKLHINKNTKVKVNTSNNELKEIVNTVNDFFSGKNSKYSIFIQSDKNLNQRAENVDDINRIMVWSKDFGSKLDIDKVAKKLYEKINDIIPLDVTQTQVYATSMYFYPQK